MREEATETRREPRLERLREALDSGSQQRIGRVVNALHPAEIAELLESLPPAQRELVWDLVEPNLDGDVLLELNDDVRSKFVSEMAADELMSAAEGMEIDDLADFVADLPEALIRRVLLSLDTKRTNMGVKWIRRDDGDFALAWVKTVGKGRVFYTSFGHRTELFWHPQLLQFYLDAVQFAVGDLDASTEPGPDATARRALQGEVSPSGEKSR